MPALHDINTIDGDPYAFSDVASRLHPSHTGQAYSIVGCEGSDAFKDSAWDDRRLFMNYLPKGVMAEAIEKYNQEASVAATRAETKRAERRAAKLTKESLNSQSLHALSHAGKPSNVSTAIPPSDTSTARPPISSPKTPIPSLAPTEG